MNTKRNIHSNNKTDNINPRLYEYLGAHRHNDKVVFRVWAPNASAVYLVGDFNYWSESNPMKKISDDGIWECSCEYKVISARPIYKYKIISKKKPLYKADPFARFMQKAPETAGIFYEDSYEWSDGDYLYKRKGITPSFFHDNPLNIYEVHLGSFMKNTDGSYFSYKDLALQIASYAKQMGYTHVQLMPVSEYPHNASLGYQVCGHYAPTSRFGTPYDFKDFVNTLHCSGVGVILTWNCCYFPDDEHGLSTFDSSYLYEYDDELKRRNEQLCTSFFDFSKKQVVDFLISNVDFFINEYHIDGIFCDSVASTLYTKEITKTYKDGSQKIKTVKNKDAIAFFKLLNEYIKKEHPSVISIAEDSGFMCDLLSDTDKDLGFDFLWNLGWTSDTISLFACPYNDRVKKIKNLLPYLKNKMSKSSILPLSHNEIIHGKKALIDKIPDEYTLKFAVLRSLFTYIITTPGKKLNFMSNELGQFDEWDYNKSVQWFILDYEYHKKLQLFVADLNEVYLKSPALCSDSISAILPSDFYSNIESQGILTFIREDKLKNRYIILVNLTPDKKTNVKINIKSDTAEILIRSDSAKYGGSTDKFSQTLSAVTEKSGARKVSLSFAPYEAIILASSNN